MVTLLSSLIIAQKKKPLDTESKKKKKDVYNRRERKRYRHIHRQKTDRLTERETLWHFIKLLTPLAVLTGLAFSFGNSICN